MQQLKVLLMTVVFAWLVTQHPSSSNFACLSIFQERNKNLSFVIQSGSRIRSYLNKADCIWLLRLNWSLKCVQVLFTCKNSFHTTESMKSELEAKVYTTHSGSLITIQSSARQLSVGVKISKKKKRLSAIYKNTFTSCKTTSSSRAGTCTEAVTAINQWS